VVLFPICKAVALPSNVQSTSFPDCNDQVANQQYQVSASSMSPMPEAKQYNLALLRDSASKLVEFVAELHENQLQEFWLPRKLPKYPLVTLIDAVRYRISSRLRSYNSATMYRRVFGCSNKTRVHTEAEIFPDPSPGCSRHIWLGSGRLLSREMFSTYRADCRRVESTAGSPES